MQKVVMDNGDKTKQPTVYTATLRANLSEFLGRVRWAKETVRVVDRGGKLIAAIIPPQDLELLEAVKKAAAGTTEHNAPGSPREPLPGTRLANYPHPRR
jgi:antitoxin (DNA-binding transcriptional repressor) of toxin-antitoxin stability system